MRSNTEPTIFSSELRVRWTSTRGLMSLGIVDVNTRAGDEICDRTWDLWTDTLKAQMEAMRFEVRMKERKNEPKGSRIDCLLTGWKPV